MMLTPDEYMALRRLIDSERESEGASLAMREQDKPKPKRKRNTKYSRAFKQISADFKKKDGSWKKGGFGRAVRAAHKLAKEM